MHSCSKELSCRLTEHEGELQTVIVGTTDLEDFEAEDILEEQ